MSRSFVVASGVLGAGALLLVACTGKTLSLGTNSTQSQLVSPSQISGTVTPCNAGEAHPNVCCAATPDQPSSCVTYPQAPFTQCGGGTATYPDPRTCCPLDGSGECAAPPPPPVDDGGAGGGGGSCSYACPPGWYVPPNASGNECCQTDSSGATTCEGSGSASPGGTACGCPACLPDSGACPPCACTPPPPPSCPACPPGWQSPQGELGVCCMTDPSGIIECFSQAGPPGPPTPTLDGGVAPIGCSGSGSTDGAVGPCSCQGQSGGHTYSVSCDPGTNVCTCTVDNGGTTSAFPDNGNMCSDPTALFTSCGFPGL